MRNNLVGRPAWPVCLVAASLVVLFDFLFYSQPRGINTAIFAGVLVTALLWRRPWLCRRWPGVVILGAMVGLTGAMVIQPTVMSGLLFFLSVLVLATVGMLPIRRDGQPIWLVRLVLSLGAVVIQPIRDATTCRRWRRSRGQRFAWLKDILQWVVPVALGLVFVGLFALANPIISNWLGNMPQLLAPLRVFMWIVVALMGWGVLRSRLRHRSRRVGAYVASDRPSPLDVVDGHVGSNWVVRSLLLFNCIFAVQTGLDLMYLYGGAKLPEHLTYAQYAQRGAYPLIATALLAALFVLIAFRPSGVAAHSKLARRLVFLWVMQNVLLVASSLWRLNMYVSVYSLSRWRVAAAIWMALVAVGLVLLIIRIMARQNNRWLIQGNTISAAVVLYACCFVNFDGLIADYNVRHCREVIIGATDVPDDASNDDGALPAPIDLAYLSRLGPEALLAVNWLAQQVEQGVVTDQNQAIKLRSDLRRLQNRLTLVLFDRTDNWRGWTLRRAMLLEHAGAPLLLVGESTGRSSRPPWTSRTTAPEAQATQPPRDGH